VFLTIIDLRDEYEMKRVSNHPISSWLLLAQTPPKYPVAKDRGGSWGWMREMKRCNHEIEDLSQFLIFGMDNEMEENEIGFYHALVLRDVREMTR